MLIGWESRSASRTSNSHDLESGLREFRCVIDVMSVLQAMDWDGVYSSNGV